MKYVPMLLAVNCIVFAAFAAPHLDDHTMMYHLALGNELAGTPVSIGDIWPGIMSYMFGHAGLVHLGTNMAMLLMVGWGLERRAGARVILYYLMGGLAGAFAHMTMGGLAGQDIPLIGASAAVSALLGAAIFHRTVGVATIAYFVIVLNVFPWFGVTAGVMENEGVSFVSHIGGAAAGMVLGACFVVAGRINRWRLGRAASGNRRPPAGPESSNVEYYRAPAGQASSRGGMSYERPNYREV